MIDRLGRTKVLQRGRLRFACGRRAAYPSNNPARAIWNPLTPALTPLCGFKLRPDGVDLCPSELVERYACARSRRQHAVGARDLFSEALLTWRSTRRSRASIRGLAERSPGALHALECAGRRSPDHSKTIMDSSSGNAGIAYAWIGQVLGIPVKLVIPDNASAERKKRMRAHDAEITIRALMMVTTRRSSRCVARRG